MDLQVTVNNIDGTRMEIQQMIFEKPAMLTVDRCVLINLEFRDSQADGDVMVTEVLTSSASKSEDRTRLFVISPITSKGHETQSSMRF